MKRIKQFILHGEAMMASVVVLLAAALELPLALAAPGSWTQGASQPAPASTSASCALDGILYVMGGHDTNLTNAFTNVWAYNPQTDSWNTNLAPLPTGRHFLGQSAVPVDGIIYLVGGMGPGWPGPAVREVAAYNPTTDTWTNGAPMPAGRGTLAACAVDGIIYAIGGFLETKQQVGTVEAYDPKINQWTPKSPMPQPRTFLTATAVNGLVYVFQGSDVFVYDPTADMWTSKTNCFSPFSWGLMSAEVNGIIYLFGGFTQDWRDGHDFTLAYDPTRDQFSTCRRMPRKRATTSCGVIGGKVYLGGGVSKEPVRYPTPPAHFYTELDVFDPQGGVMPQILNLTCESANSVHLTWQAEPGITYGIATSVDATGPWAPTASTVTAGNSTAEATCATDGAVRRFFRVFEK
jgi:hypothetical protein